MNEASNADLDMQDRHPYLREKRTDTEKVAEEMRKAADIPRHLQNVPVPDQRVPLYMGFLTGALSRPEVHAWFLSKGLADTDVKAALNALLRLSVAFYK